MSIEEENDRERHAKTALMMFNLLPCLEDLVTNGSYWKTLDVCQTNYFTNTARGIDHNGHQVANQNPSVASFWKKGI